MRPRYRKVMIISGALFVFSLVVASALSFLAFEAPANIDRPPTPSESSRNFMLVAVVSMFTSLGSAVAFVSTFILSWTRESRERAMFRIDAEKKKLENEKLTLELEQMRKNRDA